ncbi:hypothetical protein ACHAXH_000250 [Discostella pseudostelligera]
MMFPNPTNNVVTQNQFAIFQDEDTDDEDEPTPPTPHEYAMTTSAPLPHQADTPQEHSRTGSALSDSGATSHFLVDGAHAINIHLNPDPITVQLPDGRTIRSTHTCNLDIPWLRGAATQAHIVPGLTHASLVSTAKFCDAGYTVTFDALQCCVLDGPEIVLKGGRDPTTKLWRLPLRPATKPTTECAANMVTHVPANTGTPTPTSCANNVHTIPHLQNRVKYMHQAFFCPPIQTLLRAANLGFLDNIPFLQPDLIHKHLTPSSATAKGRLKLTPTGHYSTRSHPAASTPKTADIFCFAALADKQHGTFYTDCTGKLPARALDVLYLCPPDQLHFKQSHYGSFQASVPDPHQPWIQTNIQRHRQPGSRAHQGVHATTKRNSAICGTQQPSRQRRGACYTKTTLSAASALPTKISHSNFGTISLNKQSSHATSFDARASIQKYQRTSNFMATNITGTHTH